MRLLPKIVFSLIGNAVIFWLLSNKIFPTTFIIGGDIEVYGEIALFFCLLNFFVKPLLNIITLPFRWITLGLFQFIVNAGLIWILDQSLDMYTFFGASIEVVDLQTYVFVGFIVAVFNGVLNWFER